MSEDEFSTGDGERVSESGRPESRDRSLKDFLALPIAGLEILKQFAAGDV